MSKVLKKVFSIVSYGILGATIALLISFVLYVNNKPDLELWHTVVLKSEFTAQGSVRTLDEYYGRLDRNTLPVMRGIELRPDDLVRRAVIQALMCHFHLSFEAIEIAHLISFREYFATELEELKPFVEDGLVDVDDEWLTITGRGRHVVRAVCMVFDRYLREGRLRASYSKVM